MRDVAISWRLRATFALGCIFAASSSVARSQTTRAAVVPTAMTGCYSVAACIFGTNTRNGYGIEGTSAGGTGIVGKTMLNAISASTGKAGVSGYDGSTNKNAFNSGVYGTSPFGSGVAGKSSHGTGVSGSGATGVFATSSTSGGAGIYAYAAYGADLIDAYQEFDGSSAAAGDGIVVDTGYGASLASTSSRGIPLFLSITDEGDTLIDAQGDGSDAMVLDVGGNLYLAGSLTQNDAARFATRRADGRSVMTYAPREAEATLEDTGEVALRGGTAHVALDPSFAATIDASRSYLVFVTPEGENNGLYVAQKTAAGFSIRESHSGRSSIAVQYRIVAKPLVEKPRLPLVGSLFPNTARFVREKADIHIRSAARARVREARRARVI